MRAGALRHYLTIEAPTESQDAYGGNVKGWSTVATSWGSVRTASITEGQQFAGQLANATHEIVIRHAAGVDESCRVVFGSRIFQVIGVNNRDERNIEQTLSCIEQR